MMLVLAVSAAAAAQSLPAAAPTQLPAATAAVGGVPVQPVTPAKVVFADDLLTVTAQNSSLNQILGEISRATGMKITGGIHEERVFGSYGPAPPQDVLVKLLDGTGSNVLMHEDAGHRVQELVLTARSGGVSPPSPAGGNAGNDQPEVPPQGQDRFRRMQERREAVRRSQDQYGTQPGQPPSQNGDPSRFQPSPNGVKTPNQFGQESTSGQPPNPSNPPPN